jgi:tetratricopeptide (TPR) repeat protein
MAVTLMDVERFDEATAMMQDILRFTREAWGPHSPLTLSSMQNLADLYLRTDRPQQALEQLEPVVVWRERLLGEENGDVLGARYMAAEAALAADQPDKALELLQPALDIRRDSLEPNDPAWLETLRLAADIHQRTDNREAEAAHRQEAIEPFVGAKDAPGPEGIESAIRLLEIYRQANQAEQAGPLAHSITAWLDEGGEEFDALREQFDRVTITDPGAGKPGAM